MKITNDKAVSPVIGVILMVAVTMVLAGVVAAFLFAATGAMNHPNRIVAANVNQPSQDVIAVTYLGGQDTGYFDHATVNITDDAGDFVEADNLSSTVGDTVSTDGDFSGRNHVVVVGYFTDGSAQVLMDTYV